MPPVSSRVDDFGDFQQGQGQSTHLHHPSTSSVVESTKTLPLSTMTATTKTTATTTTSSASQFETSLSTVFPIPDYQAPLGDKYNAFESLTQASDQRGSKEGAATSEAPSSSRDKYADLVGLASSSAVAGNVPLVPTPAVSTAPLQPMPVSTGVVQQHEKLAGKSGVGAPEEDDFGSFLSGPSPLETFASPSKANKPIKSLPSTTSSSGIDNTQAPLGDDFGSFTAGPSMDLVQKQSSKDDAKHLDWANFTQFTSQAPIQPQVSVSSSSMPMLEPSLVPSDSVLSTTQSNNSVFSAVATTASTSTATSSLLGDLSIDIPTSSLQNSKKLSKATSGLELLEEEFSNRILSRLDEAPPPAMTALSPPLVLEPSSSGSATSLEKFGAFEGFSAVPGDGLECVSGSATSFGKVRTRTC